MEKERMVFLGLRSLTASGLGVTSALSKTSGIDGQLGSLAINTLSTGIGPCL